MKNFTISKHGWLYDYFIILKTIKYKMTKLIVNHNTRKEIIINKTGYEICHKKLH